MHQTIKYCGENENEIWQQVSLDLQELGDFFEYTAEIDQQGQIILFTIDIDLGGGFEGGYATTHFLAPLPSAPNGFWFMVHDEHWTDLLSKLFGAEDTKLGLAEMDDTLVIQTNQPETLKAILTDPEIRATLLRYKNYKLELTRQEDHLKESYLQFTLDEGITDPVYLQEIYHLLSKIIKQLNFYS